jgi:FKBP-type peptidyl-prolyl cis-trans isomerase FkpA
VFARPDGQANGAQARACKNAINIITGKSSVNLPQSSLTTLVLFVFAIAPVWAQNDFAQAAAKEPGAKVTASGLVYRSLQDGQGASPLASDKVKVHYRGTFPDGKEFDSSYKRNQPIDFPLNGVIACWTEGVQLMKVGGRAKLTCPPAIAYGARGAGGVIPPNATLQFEVELIAIAGK